LVANGKKGKKKIYQLEQEEGTIIGDEDLKVYISEFYKKAFWRTNSIQCRSN
jgi:hypothetical protein